MPQFISILKFDLHPDFILGFLSSFPDSAKNLLASPGHRVTAHGEVSMISKCKTIHNFEIVWKRKINNSCYNNFPIILKEKSIQFLNLLDRELTKSSPKINCSNRGLMFIRNMDTYYIIDREGNLLNQTIEFEIL